MPKLIIASELLVVIRNYFPVVDLLQETQDSQLICLFA